MPLSSGKWGRMVHAIQIPFTQIFTVLLLSESALLGIATNADWFPSIYVWPIPLAVSFIHSKCSLKTKSWSPRLVLSLSWSSQFRHVHYSGIGDTPVCSLMHPQHLLLCWGSQCQYQAVHCIFTSPGNLFMFVVIPAGQQSCGQFFKVILQLS